MKLKFKKLMLGDLCLAGLAFYGALRLRFNVLEAHQELWLKSSLRPIIFVLVLIISSYVFELYSLSKQRSAIQFLKTVLTSVLIAFLTLSTISYISPDLMLGRGLLGISLCLFACLQYLWHGVFRKIFDLPYLAENIVVVGTGQSARTTGQLIRSADDVNHVLKGFVTYPDSSSDTYDVPQEMVLGELEQLPEIVTRVSATKVIVTNPRQMENNFAEHILLNCKLLGVEISDVPTYFESVSGKLMLEHLEMSDLIYSRGFNNNTQVIFLKRVVDIVISLIGIVLIIPFLPFIMLLVKLDSPGPFLYSQSRVGYLGKEFRLFKFRTMGQDAELQTGAVWAQEHDPRIKPIGRFLRKSRLDELPQLYNVLIGDMSFIGPRPERPEFVRTLEEVSPFYAKRHFLKPGITGWAQIKYPYGASLEDSFEKLRYDLYYFKHMNPLLDTLILLKTIRVILFQSGGR